jgi:GSH-dependent disulfide-bond oxidoreductase
MLELYHWEPNGVFLKPLIALNEKGVPFTSRYFDALAFEQDGARFPRNVESQLHLEREGPVLVHDGEVITTSYFMLEYIAESLPGADLLPRADTRDDKGARSDKGAGAYARYRSRALGQILGLGVGAAISTLGCSKYLAPVLRNRDQSQLHTQLNRIEPVERRNVWLAVINGTSTEATLNAARERLKTPITRIESTLASAEWLAGPTYSITDIDAFATLAPLPDLAPDIVSDTRTPRLMDFLQRVRTRPAVQAALATSRTGRPQDAFVPGPEASRWG